MQKLASLAITITALTIGAGYLNNTHAYTIQQGDTLGQVATKHNTDVQTLASLNNIPNINLIFAGSYLNTNVSARPVQQTNYQPVNLTNYGTGCESYRPLVQKYFGGNTRIAMAIMQAESACNPMAVNWESHSVCIGSFGLMQISCHDGALYNPEANMQAALRKFNQSGFMPWGAYTNGSYLKFLR